MSILNTILVENNHYVCMCIYVYIYILALYTNIYIYIYLFIYLFKCLFLDLFNCLFIYLCIIIVIIIIAYVTEANIYIYTYVYILHLYIHIYIYILLHISFPIYTVATKNIVATWRCSWPTAGTATPGAGWAPASHRRCRPHRVPPGRRGSGAPPIGHLGAMAT